MIVSIGKNMAELECDEGRTGTVHESGALFAKVQVTLKSAHTRWRAAEKAFTYRRIHSPDNTSSGLNALLHFPPEISDRKSVPRLPNQPRRLRDTEHRANRTRRQFVPLGSKTNLVH
jgi:hypothetical protein